MSPQPSSVVGTEGRLFTAGWKSAMTPATALTIAALPLILYLLNRIVFPTVSPPEPPILRPKIPFFGHVISLVREQSRMFSRLYKEKAMPICTLPILHGYIYVINDPALVAAAMRNRDLSFDPFGLEFAVAILGMTKRQVEIFSAPGVMDELINLYHSSLAGENVLRMNVKALDDIASVLNTIRPGDGLGIPNLFDWLRELIAMATMKALYGKNNPLGRGDVQDIWEFDKSVGLLAMGIAQNIIAPKALAARKRAQAKLRPYYVNKLDQGDDVAAVVKERGVVLRRLGITDSGIANIDFSLTWVGNTNTIPTVFWFFAHVFASPNLVTRIRTEVETMAAVEADPTTGRRIAATVDISRLEKECPTLYGCYRESLRLYSGMIGNRRALADTTIRDPVSGREYLLRKGSTVQWTATVTHNLTSVWGDDVHDFRPERFIDTPSAEEKKRRGAMIPFGGGRNLCPGRNFALAENLGLISAVALGFEVEGATVPAATDPYPGTAMRRPDWGELDPAVKIKRRKGWEDVTWAFTF